MRGPAPPRRAGRLRPRAPSRASLHGGDRPRQRDRAERLPGPPRRGPGRDHRRGPSRLGSRRLHPLRASRHAARAGDAVRPRRNARRARRGGAARRAVAGLRAPAACRGRFPSSCASIAPAFACCARPSSGGASGPTASRPRPSSPPGACRCSSSTLVTRSIGGRRPAAVMTAPEGGGRAWYSRSAAGAPRPAPPRRSIDPSSGGDASTAANLSRGSRTWPCRSTPCRSTPYGASGSGGTGPPRT